MIKVLALRLFAKFWGEAIAISDKLPTKVWNTLVLASFILLVLSIAGVFHFRIPVPPMWCGSKVVLQSTKLEIYPDWISESEDQTFKDSFQFSNDDSAGNHFYVRRYYIGPPISNTITMQYLDFSSGSIAAWKIFNPDEEALSGNALFDSGLSGNFRTLWNSNNLFVLVQVADESPQIDLDLKPWKDINVEIYADSKNDKLGNESPARYSFRFSNISEVSSVAVPTISGYSWSVKPTANQLFTGTITGAEFISGTNATWLGVREHSDLFDRNKPIQIAFTSSDETPPRDILFWIGVLYTVANILNIIVSTLILISTAILAWISNHRARAELMTKQAEAMARQREMEWQAQQAKLRTEQMELEILKLKQEIAKGRSNPLIILTDWQG